MRLIREAVRTYIYVTKMGIMIKEQTALNLTAQLNLACLHIFPRIFTDNFYKRAPTVRASQWASSGVNLASGTFNTPVGTRFLHKLRKFGTSN